MTQPSLLDVQPEPAPVRFDGADVIHPSDDIRLGKQLARVLAVLSDGNWWTVEAIAWRIWATDRIKDPEPSISAQIRNARKAKHGSHNVQRLRSGNKTSYRLVRS